MMHRPLMQKPRTQQGSPSSDPDPLILEARQAVHDLAGEGIDVEEGLMVRLLQSMRDIRTSTAAGRSPGLDLTDLSDGEFMDLMRAGTVILN